jgi:integrase
MPEREVKKIAAEYLRPLNQGLLTVGSAVSFGSYVDEVYKPTVLKLMASSTQYRSDGVLRNYLIPAFGFLCLRDLTPLTVQKYFSSMGDSKLSHESQDKVRDVLSSVLGSAVKYGYLVSNPMQGVILAAKRTGHRVKPYVTPQQLVLLLGLIPEPYASMVFVAVYTGLRVSELVALRWRNVHVDSISIEQRYCRGDWAAPKSHASNVTIPVNRAVVERIERLKGIVVEVKAGRAVRKYRAVKSCRPDDLVFQSVARGYPMRDNSILVRFIKPAGRALGIPWVNWRSLRTSYATWLKLAGADVKDAQGLMRHSRASTTLDIYQQFVPESQRRVVEKLSQLGAGLVH